MEKQQTGIWLSPDELMKQAKEAMLQGKEPESKKDWAKVISFWITKVDAGVQPDAIFFLCKVMDCPLTDEEITAVGVITNLLIMKYILHREAELSDTARH